MDKQNVFDESYHASRQKGFSPQESMKIAKAAVSQIPEYEEVSGKKSFAVSGTSVGNVIDVSFGNSGMDTESMFGGAKLDPSGWMKPPKREFTGDINHFNYDLAEGVMNNLDEEWQHFRTKASNFYNVVNENGEIELRGKVYVPENQKGQEFLKKYDNGELGVSIEYKGYKEGHTVKDWEMTGYTFHEDPSYNTKKPKSL